MPGIPIALDKDEESGLLRAPSTGNSDMSKLCPPTGSGTTMVHIVSTLLCDDLATIVLQ